MPRLVQDIEVIMRTRPTSVLPIWKSRATSRATTPVIWKARERRMDRERYRWSLVIVIEKMMIRMALPNEASSKYVGMDS